MCRPTDHALWNKYGAAMANNFEADEAINAYKQALEIKPNLVRTWANLGIAHSNNVSGLSCCAYRLVASL